MTDTPEVAPAPAKRRGRPRKVAVPESKAEPKVASKGYKFKAQNNWDDPGLGGQDAMTDKLRIPKEILDRFPDLKFQWIMNSVFGQEDPQHRGVFEKGGWIPVHQEDLDGVFDGMFMKRGAPGEINVGGVVLHVRPTKVNDRSLAVDAMRAREAVLIKEQAWKTGDIGVSLDASHPTAIRSNKINRTIERLDIPEK